MKDAELIQTKLHNQTNAFDSETRVKNNRYHYHLKFNEALGWDWLYKQVSKVREKLGVDIELYKIHPDTGFRVVVREVDRRPHIDESQGSIFDYDS